MSVLPGRLPAAVALAVLGGTLALAVLLTTPWSTLPGPAAGGGFRPTWSSDFTPAEKAREDAFHRQVRPPAYLSLAAGLLASAVLGLGPWGGRLVAAAARPFGGGWPVQVLVGGLALALLLRLVALPFDAWTETVLRRFGLSTRGWAGWALDLAKGFGLSTVVLLGALLAVVGLARAWPHRWWLPAAAAAAALVVGLSFAYPVLVEPVFNRFTPMAAGPLRTSLLDLAARDGVPVRDVLVADASRRTAAVNAYVSGFGATRRIVVYDTLLASATPAEVRLVVAHELGHVRRQDVRHATLLGALGAAAGATLLFLLLGWGALLRRAGAAGAADPRVVALVVFLVGALGLLAGPVQNLVSRRVEARADVHALDLTGDPASFVAMQRRLAVANLADLDPNPVRYALFASHPTAPERIALARAWAAQHGQSVPAGLVR